MRLLKILILCLCGFTSFAQDVMIDGPALVQPGNTATYTAYFPTELNQLAEVLWDVRGGTVLNFTNYPSGYSVATIQWWSTTDFTRGTINVSENFNGQHSRDFYVQIGTPDMYPKVQYIDYGSVPQQIWGSFDDPDLTTVWEYSPDGVNWTQVPQWLNWISATPPATFATAYYRVKITRKSIGDVFIADPAVIYINPLNPGTITLGSAPAYNGAAAVSNTAASGGYCYSSSYQYTWEQSVEGGPWTVIGQGELYPSNAPVIIGNTQVRRKVTCSNESVYTPPISIVPQYTGVDAENRNYIRSNNIATRGIQSWYQADQLDAGKKIQETIYFDGLARPIQTVGKGTSPAANGVWKDMVSFIDYDNLGRPLRNNLPYPTASEPGKFKTNTAEQQTFYAATYNEPSPWGTTKYDDDPLNRVNKTIDPGDYRITHDVGNSFELDINNSNGIDEKVHIWRIGYVTGDLPTTTDLYQAGTLRKAVITTDKGNKIVEYSDNSGNVVLKKAQLKDLGNGLTNEHDGWLCTYYVYDDFNHLRFVITPKAVAYLDTHNWQLPQEIADELCFVYEYDGRGRVSSKKTPGVAKTSFVYDLRDRVLFTQDGNQANKSTKEWLVSFYDDLDRVTETGIFASNKTAGTLQTDINNASVQSSFTSGGTPNPIGPITVNDRLANNQPSQYISGVEIDFVEPFESLPNDNFTAEIQPYLGNAITINVFSNPSPLVDVDVNNTATYTALAYTYYDDYGFAGVKALNTSYNNLQAYGSATPDVEPIAKTSRTRGFATGSKIRVLNTNTFLNTTTYYDEQGAILQSSGDNIKNGTDVTTLQHHFDGRVMSSYTQHGLPNGVFDGFGILTKKVFDKIGRLVTLYKQFGTSVTKKIAEYEYDEMGDLQFRKLGQKPNSTDPLETLEYSYNANGALTGINKSYALSANNSDQFNNFFGLYLGYENFDKQFTNDRFDHVITGAIWKSQGDNTPRKYDYTYDNAGRYTAANFTQKGSPADITWTNANADFSETSIMYDENGNLKQLYRKGVVAGNASPLEIDKLNYTYKQVLGGEWSNQVLSVFDNNPTIGAVANGKLGDFKDEVFNVNTDDYSYDVNGNLVKDNNKKIRNNGGAGITYNIFNKPEKIIIENKSTVELTYDASGTKLAKKVTPASGGTAKTTYYLGDFVYEDNDLQYILHEEGKLRVMDPVNGTSPLGAAGQTITGNIPLNGGKWGVFDYFIKDQSGSTRMVITEESHREIFKCTMEDAASTEEDGIFGMVDNSGNPLPNNEVELTRKPNSGYVSVNGWSSNTSQKVSKLVTTGAPGANSVGPNVLLKVMAGDNINAIANYYYDLPPANATITNTNILSTIATSIIGGFTGSSISQTVKDAGNSLQTTLQNPGASPLIPFLGNQPTQSTDRPKAYLNYVFFDENFNYIPNEGGAELVKANSNDDQVSALNKRVPKNGYVYVYLSNESDWPVYFDDFTVTHDRGAIVEESHYYPHGMKISAISSRAFNKPLNKYGFQGDYSEEEEESGYNEFDLRTYDPQIGRWIQADPYDEFASGYVGMGNDPVNKVDPDGGLTSTIPTQAFQSVLNAPYTSALIAAEKSVVENNNAGDDPGDFYNQQGRKLGTDGENDGRNYVLTNSVDIRKVEEATKAGKPISKDKLYYVREMPSYSVRQKMGEAVDRSNKPTADDPTGGRHEEGGVIGKTPMGIDHPGFDVAMDAEPGVPPKEGETKANVDTRIIDWKQGGRPNFVNISIFMKLLLTGSYHVHPSGTFNLGTNSTFAQPPSYYDYLATQTEKYTRGMKGFSYVLSPRTNTVYFLLPSENGKEAKQVATFPLDKFRSIK